MHPATAGALVCAGGGVLAYAMRSKSSGLLGPSVYRGPGSRKALALTFDDGPSAGSMDLLKILAKYRVKATFFHCGVNIRRMPSVTSAVAREGHEIGNHSDTHPLMCFRAADFIYSELARAQVTIQETTGVPASLFRAPYGVRWFGMREAQRRLNLMGVMWTVIGLDWKLDAAGIAARLLAGAKNGAIFCLHDGRETLPRPDITPTIHAVERAVPILLEQGFQFETVSQLLCQTN
ncbi:MAG: polysaccharide deacetylase family protein [Bryobacteraceae bacterium]